MPVDLALLRRCLHGELTAGGSSLNDRLSSALASLSQAIPSTAADCFLLPDPRSALPASNLVVRVMDPAALVDYTAFYGQFDPCLEFGVSHPGVAHRLTDFLSPAEHRLNAYSAELLARHDLGFAMGISVQLPHDLFLGIGLHRSRSVGDYRPSHVEVLGRLADDLSALTFQALIEDRFKAASTGALLDQGTLEFDASGATVEMDGHGARLLAGLHDPSAPLRDALEAQARPRIRDWLDRDARWLRTTLFLGGPGSRMLVERIRPGSWEHLRAELKRAILTRREEEVALEAIKGTPTALIAERLRIAPATAKRHLLHIYSKLGVYSRTELIGRVSGIDSVTRDATAVDRLLSRTRLTRREKAVVLLALRGLGNRQIAQRLSVAPVTVKLHLRSVYRRIGVANRSCLAAWLLRQR